MNSLSRHLFITMLIGLAGVLQASPDSASAFPVHFEPADARGDRYLVRGPGFGFDVQALTNSLRFVGDDGGEIRTRFLGARGSAKIVAGEKLSAVTNYFVGNSPKAWRTAVPRYREIRVNGLYPGIDLLYYGHAGAQQLEYDFIVHPGADPSAIRFAVSGGSLSLDKGDLIIARGDKKLHWKAPVIYQMTDARRVEVAGNYELDSGKRVRFHVAPHDRSKDLIIDPALAYVTYLGGSSREWSRGVATDPAGNVYITGLTSSTDLKTSAGVIQPAFAGKNLTRTFSGDAFVAKFTPAGVLTYMTYLGGKLDEFGFGIAADASGNAYVVGMTTSSDFPVTQGSFQPVFGGSGGNFCERAGDAFVTKLNPTGSQLVYSTYLGGRQDDFGTAIAVDPSGNAYVTGWTISTDFPITQGAYSTDMSGIGGQTGRPPCNGLPWFDTGDAFVTKLNPSGSQVVFSTYLGGSGDDAGIAIALDSSQNVFVGGFTLSKNFPTTTGAPLRSFSGTDPNNFFFVTGDGFVTKLASNGASLMYSTYLGGIGEDGVTGIAIAADGTAWVTGATSSVNFPVTSGAIQKQYKGYINVPFDIEQVTGDAFVTHLNSDGTAFLYSTFLGGAQNDLGAAVRIDPSGLVLVTGFTDSSHFPVTANAAQKVWAGDGLCSFGRLCGTQYFQFGDGFITAIDPASTTPVYSTFIGGGRDDTLLGMALDGSGGVWAGGSTHSTDVIASSGTVFQKANAGRDDALLVHISTISGPSLNAVANAASNATSAVSPGMIFVGYGSQIGPDPLVGAALDSNGKLATSRSNTTITFDGVLSPIVYVSASQVAGVVPYSVAGKTSTQVIVTYNGKSTPPVTVPVVAAAPGLFSSNFSGTGPAVAFNQDGTLNSASNPAARGTVIVLYGTGEGLTNPPGADGTIAVGGALANPTLGCTGTVGVIPGVVQYCGSVPGVVEGEFQVNLQTSSSTPTGPQPVAVSIGSFKSQSGLTVFMK